MTNVLTFNAKEQSGFLTCPKCANDDFAVLGYKNNGKDFIGAIACSDCGHEISINNGYL